MGYMAIRDCDAATSVSGPCDGLVMGLRDGRGALIVVVFIRAALSDSIVRADVRAPLAPARIGAPTPPGRPRGQTPTTERGSGAGVDPFQRDQPG
jgi:hypothetical protein